MKTLDELVAAIQVAQGRIDEVAADMDRDESLRQDPDVQRRFNAAIHAANDATNELLTAYKSMLGEQAAQRNREG